MNNKIIMVAISSSAPQLLSKKDNDTKTELVSKKDNDTKTYTFACMYTSDPRLTNVCRLVTLFFSKFSMFRLRFELQVQSQAKAHTTKHQLSITLTTGHEIKVEIVAKWK